MKKLVSALLAAAAAAALYAAPAAAPAPDAAPAPAPGKVLYVYDEDNEQSAPYVANFRAAFAAEGIAFDEATAAQAAAVDPAAYGTVVIHGMVMAFNRKSPVRDWLKKGPPLAGKKVSLLVTANRWFLDSLFKDLTALLEKEDAVVVDAVSMATKRTDDAAEAAAVRAQVARLKR